MEMALNLSSDTLKLESQLKYCYTGKRGRGEGGGILKYRCNKWKICTGVENQKVKSDQEFWL